MRAFHRQYIPDSTVKRLRIQFKELVQGDMTVDQYAQQFAGLSRYASDLVTDEFRRCRRFEKGLRPQIRDWVAVSLYTEFVRLLEAVRAVETSWETTRRERDSRRTQGAVSSKGDRKSKKCKSSSPESGPEVLKRSDSIGSSSRGARHQGMLLAFLNIRPCTLWFVSV